MGIVERVSIAAGRKTGRRIAPPVPPAVSTAIAFALEPRFMFDAAGVASAVDHADQQAAEHAADAAQAEAGKEAARGQEQAVALDQALATVAPPAAGPLSGQDRREAAFVDSSVADWRTLAAGVGPGVEMVVLDGSRDGLAQMADWARGHAGYDAIHVLSHGAEGKIQLGTLTLDTAATAARAADLAAVGAALGAGGDLLLYGCQVAGGAGEGFLQAVAQRTGADVAASTDATGAAARGGNWVLEASSGPVETIALTGAGYASILAAPSIANLGGSVAWASGAIVLDSGADAAASDADFAGAWTGATLTVARSTGAWSADGFGFTAGSGLSISGGDLLSGGVTVIGSATSAGGTLGVTFNGNADATVVSNVLRGVTYANATPAGDAVIRFTLGDGTGGATTADVTVTSGTIHVTTLADTTTVDVSDGVSFSEAMAIADAQAGTESLVLGGVFAGQTVTPVGTLSFGESRTINGSAASGVSLAGGTITVGTGATLTVTSSGTGSIANALAGAGGFAKSGGGTLSLTGGNAAYDGAISVTAGRLVVASADALGSAAAGTAVSGSGTLELGNGVALAENLTISGSGSSGAGALAVTGGGSATVNGSVTLGADAMVTLPFNASGTFLTVNGSVIGSATLTKNGPGTLTLSNAANSTTHSGATTLAAGTLAIGSDANLGAGALTFSGAATLAMTASGTIDNAIALNGYGTFRTDPNVTLTLSTPLTGSGGGLKKDGTGTLILGSGTHTFNGSLDVWYGTLQLDNAALSQITSAMTYTTIAGTGSLFASGSTNTLTLYSDGALSPGAGVGGIGTLTINGNLATIASFVRTYVVIDINGTTPGTGYDRVIVNGTVNFPSATENRLEVRLAASYNPPSGDSYAIIQAGGAFTGTLAGYANGGTSTVSGRPYGVAYATDGGSGVTSLTLNGPANTAPVIAHLHGDSVAWAGENNTVTLDLGGDLTVTDDRAVWTGATLTVQRVTGGTATPTAADVFGLNLLGSGINQFGNELQASSPTFATFTNTGGVLTFTFTSYATTTNVRDVMRRVTYRNDTPFGDTTIRFTLTDPVRSFTDAEVTVRSAAIYVTKTDDDADGDVADGVSLREALARSVSQAGADTILFTTAVASGSTITLAGGTATLGAGDTIRFARASGANSLTIAQGTGGGLVLAGAGTLSVDGGETLTVSAAVSGTGGLTVAGGGTLVLSGTNSYGGTTAVQAGVLSVAADGGLGGGLGGGALTLGAGTTLRVTGAGAIGNAVTLAGDATIQADAATAIDGAVSGDGFTLTKTGAAALTLTSSGNGSSTWRATVSAGALNLGAANRLGSGQLTLAGGTLDLTGTMTLANAVTVSAASAVTLASGAEATLDGTIAGTGGLTVTGVPGGAGERLTLGATGNAAGWSGALSVTDAVLQIGGGGALSSGSITFGTGSGLAITAGTTIGNAIAIDGATTVTVGGGYGATLSGVLSGSGAVTLAAGTGSLTLAGNNTHTGNWTLGSGTLVAGSGAVNPAWSSIGDAATVTIGNGGVVNDRPTLQLGGNETIGGLASGSGADTEGKVVLGANTLTMGGGGDTSFAGAISGTGGIVKSGGGVLELTGTSTYGGATVVNGGTLTLASAAGTALHDAGAVTVSSGATLYLDRSDETVGTVTGAGTLTLNGGTLTLAGDGSTEFSGVVRDGTSGTGGLVKQGTGTLTLSGANTHSGGTTVSGGTLVVAGGAGLGSGTLTLRDGTTLKVTATATIANAITLQNVDTAQATIETAAGTEVGLSGRVTGSGGLIKAGTGTLTLQYGHASNHNLLGDTTVSAGTLSLAAGTVVLGATTVRDGGTLAGSGTIDGAVTVNHGGILAPGVAGTNDGAGTLTIGGDLTLDGTLRLDLGSPVSGTPVVGTHYDQVKVGGTVTLGATSALDVNHTATTGNNGFVVIDRTGAGAIGGGIGGTVAEGGTLTSNGRQYGVSYAGGDGNDLTLRDNAPPVITSTAPTRASEDGGYSYAVTATDADGDALTVTATTLPSWLRLVNGVLSGTPGQGDVGSHDVVLSVGDGKGGTATQSFTITVEAVNDAPVIVTLPPATASEGRPYAYVIGATDEEGEAISYAAATLPSWMSFSNGVLSGTPTWADVGVHGVVVTATDASGATTTQSFTVTVGAVNAAPVITSVPATLVNEDSPYSYVLSATDREGEAISYAVARLPSWLSLSNGVLSGTPGQGDVGVHSVVVTATDASGATTTQSFAITVSEVNEAPVITSTPAILARAGEVYSYAMSATDEEGQAIAFSAGRLPAWMSFAGGVLTGTPGAGDVGGHDILLLATDASGAVTAQSFTVIVTGEAAANTPPALVVGQPGPAAAGQPFFLAIATSDPDAGDAWRIAAASLPSWLVLTDNGDGTAMLSGTPGSGDAGIHTVALTVTDTHGASGTRTVTLTVETPGGVMPNITQASNAPASAREATGGTGTGAVILLTTPAAMPDGSSDARGLWTLVPLSGKVEGTASSAEHLQRQQGLTTAATSNDPGASADDSALVRNAAHGDAGATSSFYGAATVIPADLSGSPSTTGSGWEGRWGEPGANPAHGLGLRDDLRKGFGFFVNGVAVRFHGGDLDAGGVPGAAPARQTPPAQGGSSPEGGDEPSGRTPPDGAASTPSENDRPESDPLGLFGMEADNDAPHTPFSIRLGESAGTLAARRLDAALAMLDSAA